MTELDDLMTAVRAARDQLAPDLDDVLLDDVVAAEIDHIDDQAAAIATIANAVSRSIERTPAPPPPEPEDAAEDDGDPEPRTEGGSDATQREAGA